MFCPKCGNQLAEGARFCAGCGQALGAAPGGQVQAIPPGSAPISRTAPAAGLVYPKNPPLSPHLCWVNLLLGGLAQMIHGQVGKGLMLLIAVLVGYVVIPGLGGLIVCVVSIVDAFMLGKTLRAGVPVRKWQFFPSTT